MREQKSLEFDCWVFDTIDDGSMITMHFMLSNTYELGSCR